MPDRQTVFRIIGIGVAAVVVVALGIVAVIYFMARHRPAAYQETSETAAGRREEDLQVFRSIRRQAEDDFLDRGAFTATLTAAQLNAAIAHYRTRERGVREFDRLREIDNLQVALAPGRATIMGSRPSKVGSVVVSVNVSVVDGPRLEVESVRAGSLGLKSKRVQDMVRDIENHEFVYQTAEREWLRITDIAFGDGSVTVTGVREEE